MKAKIDRKTVEKNRRIQMKNLCFKLSSVIPKHAHNYNFSKDASSQYDHLDQAIDYIKNLSERIERLKQKKNSVTGEASDKESDGGMAGELGLPVVEVRHQDSIVEVVLITSLKTSFVFYETIKVLEEEGIDVLNASFSVVRDKIFYTIHSQVVSSINDFEASKVYERLKKLI